MVSPINEQLAATYRLISIGDAEGAVAASRDILAGEYGHHPVVRLNCAGFLIDAGERFDDEHLVHDGVAMLDALRRSNAFAEQSREHATLRYNLANGRAAPLHMESRRRGQYDMRVRDLRDHERAVVLYYESTESLRKAEPHEVINCAAVLRLEGRIYEAIDLLDGVAQRHPAHPNAHQKLAELLWLSATNMRGCASKLEALLVAACVHYSRAVPGFNARGDSVDAERSVAALRRLRELAEHALPGDLDTAIAEIGDLPFGTKRYGEPVGLGVLARSPYRDEDDLWLIEELPSELREIVADAAGTFCVGRSLLEQASAPAVRMPRWGDHTPDAGAQLRNAAIRQFWSVVEKVAWLVNQAFKVGLQDSECKFYSLFQAPNAKRCKSLGITQGSRFYPALDVENAGLRALAGLSCAFDAENGFVYVPLKRLRNAVEHRVPEQPATQDDAAFLLGIARAAILHAVDAVLIQQMTTGQPPK